MFDVRIVGYKKIEKEGRVMYLLFAESEENDSGRIVGKQVCTAFISGETLDKMKVNEIDLLGALGQFVSVKTDNGYKTVVGMINA